MSIGLQRGTVAVTEHKVEWEISAKELIEELKDILKDDIIEAQHIGSTSIKSICAKPIVDIVVGVSDFDKIFKHGVEVAMFSEEYKRFWKEFGSSKKMVLSTSLDNIVTSRMMSVVAIEGKLFFQTDNTFRKYKQLKGNSNVALCIDNIQIEGQCEEIGHPSNNTEFCTAYKAGFPDSYSNYTALENKKYMLEKYCGI